VVEVAARITDHRAAITINRHQINLPLEGGTPDKMRENLRDH